MLKSDICETVAVKAIEEVIFGEWKHEGGVLGVSSRHVNFEIDGKEYVFVLHEVKEGQDFSQYLEG
jgi:hypothetical protein